MFWRQEFVAVAHLSRFSAVAFDGLLWAWSVAVMHQMGRAETEAPERWSTELVGRGLVQEFWFGGLWDTVPGSNIVDQEVAVRMDYFVAEKPWDFVRSTID